MAIGEQVVAQERDEDLASGARHVLLERRERLGEGILSDSRGGSVVSRTPALSVNHSLRCYCMSEQPAATPAAPAAAEPPPSHSVESTLN